MKFDYSELKKQLKEQQFNYFVDVLSNDVKLRNNIIDKVQEEGIFVEPIGTGTTKKFRFESIDYTNIIFEKIDEETIKVFIHQNSFGHIY